MDQKDNWVKGGLNVEKSLLDSYFYALNRVIDAIYHEEDLGDTLYFIVSLAKELTGAKGSTIRVLEHGSFNLKVVASCGLSQAYLRSGAIDHGKSITEIMRGDTIVIDDFAASDSVQDFDAAKKEGVNAVIGIPFTVNETTYTILRVYFGHKKTPMKEEIELLNSLGRLSCLAINMAAGRDVI